MENEFFKDGKEKSEDRIQEEIHDWLQERNIFSHSVPNEAAGRSKIKQMQLVKMGLTGGVADLVVWWPKKDGVCIGYVEVKDRKGTKSKTQIVFTEKCQKNGIFYHLARGLGDIEKITLEMLGFIPEKRDEKRGKKQW